MISGMSLKARAGLATALVMFSVSTSCKVAWKSSDASRKEIGPERMTICSAVSSICRMRSK